MTMIHFIATLAFYSSSCMHTSTAHIRSFAEHFKRLTYIHPFLFLRVEEGVIINLYAIFVEEIFFFWFPFSKISNSDKRT